MLHLFRKKKLEPGGEAPDFELSDSDGRTVRLSTFRGKKAALLSFYPMDFTPG